MMINNKKAVIKIKLIDVIDTFISGDWGNDTKSEETPYAVSCIRGADIVPINKSNFLDIPVRFVPKRSLDNKTLQVGDIIVEKSGGSPVQSTGRVCFISEELFAVNKNLVCSNFCVAFRVKQEWDPKYIFLYLQYIYNAGIFFNFEGKTSGIKNLQLEIAYQSINIDVISLEKQGLIKKTISTLDSKISLNRTINQNLPTPDHSLKVAVIRRAA